MTKARQCKYCDAPLTARRKLTCVDCKSKRLKENNQKHRKRRIDGLIDAQQGRVSRVELFDIFKNNGMLERYG